MKCLTILAAFATLLFPALADDNSQIKATDNFQIKAFVNLNVGLPDAFINMSNTGASWGKNIETPAGHFVATGNICANVYVFAPDEELIACCSCFLTPNALASYSLKNDLISNTLTPSAPTSVVVKLVTSAACVPDTNPSSSTFGHCPPKVTPAASCNPATVGQVNGQPLTGGLVAWGTNAVKNTTTTPATYGMTEEHFEHGELSAQELARATQECTFIQFDGSGFGICKACKQGYQ